jgi:putative effector of murein hydrolase LrgA (UPF0299 family)
VEFAQTIRYHPAQKDGQTVTGWTRRVFYPQPRAAVYAVTSGDLMGILLFLLGLLAAASGGLKLRSRVRSLLGVSPLAVVETAVGVLTVLGSGAGLGRVRPLAWAVVVVAAGLIAVSSTAHVRSMLQRREKREASEAERLGSFLQS